MKTPEQSASEWSLWILWTVATSAASGLVFVFPYWIAALIYGAVLGVAQFLLLRSRIARAHWWIAASLAGWPLGLAASYLVHWVHRQLGGVHLPIAIYSAASGAALGWVQWLVLRRDVRRAGWWIGANTLGWGAGFALGFHLARDRALPPVLGGTVSGAVGGALTGAALIWLLRRQRQDQTS